MARYQCVYLIPIKCTIFCSTGLETLDICCKLVLFYMAFRFLYFKMETSLKSVAQKWFNKMNIVVTSNFGHKIATKSYRNDNCNKIATKSYLNDNAIGKI